MDQPVRVRPRTEYEDGEIAWLVTEENMAKVAEWCGGFIRPCGGGSGNLIEFPINPRYGEPDCCSADAAPVGAYLVKYPDGFESFTPRMFADHYRYDRTELGDTEEDDD